MPEMQALHSDDEAGAQITLTMCVEQLRTLKAALVVYLRDWPGGDPQDQDNASDLHRTCLAALLEHQYQQGNIADE